MITRLFDVIQGSVESLLCFVRCDISDGAVRARVVIPVDPFQGFPFDLTNRLPGSKERMTLGLEQADDAFRGGIVMQGIPDAADGCVDTRLCQSLGVSDRQVLAAAVAVVD